MSYKVSVIIPVYNDFQALEGLIPFLNNQTLNKTDYEVIIVDNCSDSDIRKNIPDSTEFIVLKECKHLASPYSCRNRGIEIAKGEIIALLDSTCYPVNNWLEDALHCFDSTNSDLIAGEVGFRFKNERPSAGEYFDSVTNIKMKESVTERKVAKTANLFVKKSVFDKIGLFQEGIRSGGDVAWTAMATGSGFKLSFCEKAMVKKEARGLKELIKKQYRVGKGQPVIWKKEGKTRNTFKIFLSIFKPISLKSFKKNHKKHINNYSLTLLSVYLTASIIRVVQRTGNLVGVLNGK